MFKRLLLVIFTILGINSLQAQTWETGVFWGASGYMGDINPRKFYQLNDMAYGLQVKRNFDGYWSAKLNLMHGTVGASDSQAEDLNQRNRDLRFYSPITEASLQVEFNFFNYVSGISRVRMTPYLFTGIGGFLFNPKVDMLTPSGQVQTYKLRDFLTEGQTKPYDNLAMSIPYGVGMKYNFRGQWNLIAELGYRTAFTDYLDDVSQNYPSDLATMTGERRYFSDPSLNDALAGTQRGDYRKRDTYFFAGLSLTFTFVSHKCPVVDN